MGPVPSADRCPFTQYRRQTGWRSCPKRSPKRMRHLIGARSRAHRTRARHLSELLREVVMNQPGQIAHRRARGQGEGLLQIRLLPRLLAVDANHSESLEGTTSQFLDPFAADRRNRALVPPVLDEPLEQFQILSGVGPVQPGENQDCRLVHPARARLLGRLPAHRHQRQGLLAEKALHQLQALERTFDGHYQPDQVRRPNRVVDPGLDILLAYRRQIHDLDRDILEWHHSRRRLPCRQRILGDLGFRVSQPRYERRLPPVGRADEDHLTGAFPRNVMARSASAGLVPGLTLELRDARFEIGLDLLGAFVLGHFPQHLLQRGKPLLRSDCPPEAVLGCAVGGSEIRGHPSHRS